MLKSQPIPPIPEQTVQVAQKAFRKGNTYLQMRDLLGTFFTDDQFMEIYPADGQPTYSPWRLALVSVMQFAENLTDRQAADAVRARIDWKYALSLELTDDGFDFSVLSEFRQRLIEHEAGENLLNEMLRHFQEAELLSSGGQQRTDSTHVLAAVRHLNRLELVGRTLQQALDSLAQIVPGWLQTWVAPDWYTRYGKLLTEFRLPRQKTEREALALQIGQDGLTLLTTVLIDPRTPDYLRHLEAVEVLRQVWVQQYVQMDGVLHWRTGKEMPPATKLIQSPFDREAHYSRKGERTWFGYKVHCTETCNSDQPHFITHVKVTPATMQDVEVVEVIHAQLAKLACLPDEHLVDMGYTSGPLLTYSLRDYGVQLVGPIAQKQAWQEATGYDRSAFTIDWTHRQVTCPQGQTSQAWTTQAQRSDHYLVRAQFDKLDCEPCPTHDLCTRTRARTLVFPEQAICEAIDARQYEQHTPEFREKYNKRAGVEGTISQGVFALGMRRSRYRGLAKTQLQFTLTASAMNLTRVLNWYNEPSRSETRLTHFGRLAA